MSNLEYLKSLKSKSLSGETDKELDNRMEEESGGYKPDERILELKLPDNGRRRVVGRFLPEREGSKNTFIKKFTHMFKGTTGGWLIETCPTSIGKPCPVCEKNTELWNQGNEAEIRRFRKRNLKYYSNFYVISDSANPDNNGKVFILQYPKSVFDKLKKARNPDFPDDPKVNPFDLFGKGADFVIEMTEKKITGWDGNTATVPNYDDSKFKIQSEFMDGDLEKIAVVMDNMHNIDDLVEDIKEYDEIKKRLEMVDGEDKSAHRNLTVKRDDVMIDEDEDDDTMDNDDIDINDLDDDLPF